MIKPRVLILRTAGTNCDQETGFAFQLCGGAVEYRHISSLQIGALKEFQIFVVPGGFTYGDYLGAGRILANELRTKFKEGLKEFIDDRKLMIGICNGFQVLIKAGLLPATDGYFKIEATLTDNKSGKFEDRWVYLKPGKTDCVFLKDIDRIIQLPVAHAEGRFMASDEILSRMNKKNMIGLKYCKPNGGDPDYPYNPNGSVQDIAGICDTTGQIFGLMPHPERFIEPIQHPRHTRDNIARADGIEIIKRGIEYVQQHF